MGTARIAILVLAAVAAAFAAYLVQGLVGGKKDQIAAPKQIEVPMGSVLVAAKDLEVGHRIAAGDMKWQAWPEAALTDAYITQKGETDALTATEGATVRQPMLQGEPVTNVKVVRSGETGFMAAMITQGSRAYSVKISEETGAAGFILPNDRVDVLLTEEQDGDHNTRTLLSNVRVLAIDQTYREEDDKRVVVGRVATLELTPTDSELIAQADAGGKLSLALRSLADFDPKADAGAPRRNGTVTVLRYGISSHKNLNGVSE